MRRNDQPGGVSAAICCFLSSLKSLPISTKYDEGPVVVNGVQHVIHPPVHLAAWPDDDRSSRLVLIVREIAAEAVERSLLAFQELSSLSAGTAAGSIGASNV